MIPPPGYLYFLLYIFAGHMELLMAPLMYSFWRMLESKWRLVCGDIQEGRINPELNLDPLLVEELRECFTEGFHGIAKRIWPNLR